MARNVSNPLHSPGKPKDSGTCWCGHIVDINELEHIHASEDMDISRGDFVIITTRYGLDMAKICGQITDKESIDATQLRRIIRLAQDSDYSHRDKLKKKEKHAFDVCQKYIEGKRLPMNLIASHYMLNEERLLLLYTAEKRIDFRNLVKDLANSLKTRIEMRHIGVRDESRIHGGIAVCGRLYCCHGAMNRLAPVSIKMAKDQNLSLNTKKITGACGRLLCCLAYEQQHYSDFRKNLPEEGTRIESRNTRYTVSEINVLKGTVLLVSREGDHIRVPNSQFIRMDNGEWKLNEEKT